MRYFTPNPKHRSLRYRLVRAVAVSGIFTVAIAIPQVAVDGSMKFDNSPQPASPAGARLARIIEQNDCYTGDSPSGDIPTKAVVTRKDDNQPHLVPSDVGFAIMEGSIPGTLHAFCDA